MFTCKHFPLSNALLGFWGRNWRFPILLCFFVLPGKDRIPDTSIQQLTVTTSPPGSCYCSESSIPHFPMSLQWIYSSHISSASLSHCSLTVSRKYIVPTLISRTLNIRCMSHRNALKHFFSLFLSFVFFFIEALLDCLQGKTIVELKLNNTHSHSRIVSQSLLFTPCITLVG